MFLKQLWCIKLPLLRLHGIYIYANIFFPNVGLIYYSFKVLFTNLKKYENMLLCGFWELGQGQKGSVSVKSLGNTALMNQYLEISHQQTSFITQTKPEKDLAEAKNPPPT